MSIFQDNEIYTLLRLGIEIWDSDLPNSGPQTRGIISRIAEHEESSKQNCLANRQLRIAIVVLILEPENYTCI